MLNTLSLLVVLLAGIYLVALAAVALGAPALAASFLSGFANSAYKHYGELLARVLVGAAFVVQSARMPYSAAFSVFGWLLVVTTAVLFLVPWQWHHRFAQGTVPLVLRFLPLVAVVSLLMGGLVLWSAIRGLAG